MWIVDGTCEPPLQNMCGDQACAHARVYNYCKQIPLAAFVCNTQYNKYTHVGDYIQYTTYITEAARSDCHLY